MRSRTPIYRFLLAMLLPVFGRKLTLIEGSANIPDVGGCIFAVNHVDWLDGFYLTAAAAKAANTPVIFLSASNNYWWTTIAVQVPHEQKSQIVGTAVSRLRRGDVICVFAEGRRNPEPQLLPGRTGAIRMALAADVPIIPVGITCSPGKSMGQSIRFLLSRRHPVTVRFGRPITVAAAGIIDHEFLRGKTEELMRAIAPLCGKTY